MKTTIQINDDLLTKAMKLTNTKTKRETIEVALINIIKTLNQKNLLRYRGKEIWEGNFDDMRST